MNKSRLAAPLAALLLAGCISFGPKVPDTLFTLTPESAPAAGATASGTVGGSIVVMEPEAAQKLDVQRIPVQVDTANVAYLKDAQWVERPALLMQRLIAETIRTRTGRLVIEEDPVGDSAVRLSGRLLDMGYDAQGSAVVVRFEAARETPGGQIDTRRFESSVANVEPDRASVGLALNRAANDVARQVADWMT